MGLLFPSEEERARMVAERSDRYLQTIGHDLTYIRERIGEDFYNERLSVASATVASADYLERLDEKVWDMTADFTSEFATVARGLGELAEATQTGFREVAQSIDDLGERFEWGMDKLLLQMKLERKDLQKILETLHAPLDTQAKELRNRGFRAWHNGWDEEALRDLLASEEKNYSDFTVHHATACILLRKRDWAGAQSYFEKVAKYAQPYSIRDAAEGLLGASFACRRQKDFLSAYRYTKQACVWTSMWAPRFEHSINAVCLSHAPDRAANLTPDELRQEALSALKEVLWKKEEYAVRVDTELYFEPIRAECNAMLQVLRGDLQREAESLLVKIDAAVSDAESACGTNRFASIGAKALKGRTHLRELCRRNSILDFLRLRRDVPVLETYILHVRDLVDRVDKQMEPLAAAYRMARSTVAPNRWAVAGAEVEKEFEALKQLYESETIPAYEELLTRAPLAETSFYTFTERELVKLKDVVWRHLKTARDEKSRLGSEAFAKEQEAKKKPFGGGAGCLLGILMCVLVVVATVIFGIETESPVAALLTVVVALTLVILVYAGTRLFRRGEARKARNYADSYEMTEVEPLGHLLDELGTFIKKCQRRECFELPEHFRLFLSEAGLRSK